MNKNNKWNMILDHNIATEDELKLVTSIIGFNDEALDGVVYAREGYHTVEDYADSELAYCEFMDGDTFTIDFSVVGSVEGLAEAFFNKDYTLIFDDSFYIYDQSNGVWYGIEYIYHYLDNLNEFLEAGEYVEFHLVEDDDVIMTLESNL